MRSKLLAIVIALVWATHLHAQTPLFHLKYDEANGTTTAFEEIASANLPITNQFNKPERVVGVTGNALRTDGFSTWIQTTKNLSITTSMSVSTWIVLESYPADEETVYSNLAPSAMVSQYDGTNGFTLSINTFGVWFFTASINGLKHTVQAPNSFPLYSWTHVAATIDGPGGSMKLYLNGVLVATITTPVNGTINKANVPLIIGKSNQDRYMGIFLINAMNATFDNTKIFGSALASANVSSEYNTGLSTISTTGEQAVSVSPIRFQNDLQRPVYHALPPANWTNEPHGLVYHNGTYHMFYQRTPNGPYKTMMHWGHMTSTDLVHWTNTKDALWPELNLSPTTGYDMKGIWSGDVVMNNGVAHAFYTCVNHTGPYNPGVAHATSSDVGFKTWTKAGPVVDRQFVNDFRDPYIFKDGATWYMIIGAAYSGFGGLDCYTSTDLNTWTHKSNFCTVAYSSMDIGSDIWEMPVFESIGNGKYILIVNPIGGTVGKYGPKYTRAVYWVGTFTGGSFTPDYTVPKNLDVIHGHLSPTVEKNTSGQLVAIGMVDERRNSQAQLSAGWCHVFSLPRVYTLLPDNKTLGQAPSPELATLRAAGSQQTFSNVNVNSTSLLTTPASASVEMIVNVPSTTASKYGVNIRVSPDRQENTKIYYDAVVKKIVLDKSQTSLSGADEEKVLIAQDYDEVAFGKPTSFHIYIDNSIIDVFINEKAAFSARLYPTRTDSRGIELFSEGSASTFTSVDLWTSAVSNVPVTGVTLSKSATTLITGNNEQLVANVLPANATNKNVTWASSNTSKVAVSATGLLTAVATGSATITATTVDGNFTATCTVTVVATPSYQVYDFEVGNLTGWTTTGLAFNNLDVSSASTYWGGSFNKQGTYHMWDFNDGGDAQTGDMKTANFTLGGDGRINFLVSGGNDINNLYLGLYRASDNALLMKETGVNDEAYVQRTFDATAYIGVQCYVKAVDNVTGGWGHINFDNIRIPTQSSVPVTGVTLNKTSTSLSVGNSETLVATVSPSNATNKSVTWSSSNTSVATVNTSGTVTAVGPGSATITVTTIDGGKTATCTVTTTQLDYVLDFESGNLQGWSTVSGNAFAAGDVCTDVNWGWGGPFNQQGAWHLWGFKVGGDADVGEIKTTNFVLAGGGQVTALVGGGNDINNLYIALCRTSDNLVISKQTGSNDEAYTTKTLDGSAYIGTQCYIKIVDATTGGFGHINVDNVRIPVSAVPAHAVTLNKATTSINVGSTEALVATVLPSNATNKNVTWSSSNTAVATVNSSGVVTATGAGTATITATTVDGGKTASCTVTSVQQYLVLDFEVGNLTGWSVFSGNAFSTGDVCTDVNWGWGGPFNQQGSWHLWGFKSGGDAQTGELRSSNFYLSGNGQVTAMIGGGNDLSNLYVALVRVSDGLVISKQTGNNDEAYTTKTLNGAGYIGNQCYIRVFDGTTGGFGHINVDNVRVPVQSTGSGRANTHEMPADEKVVENDYFLDVFPNPIVDDLMIDLLDIPSASIRLLDLSGKVLLNEEFSSGGLKILHVRQRGIKGGMYILRINTPALSVTKKIIVK
jgi:fructan beta-fructosidase